MRGPRTSVWAVGCLLCLPALSSAELPTLQATASKTEVTVGEAFTIEVKGTAPPGTSWTFPAQAGNDVLELKALPSAGEAPPSQPPPAGVQRYEAMVFALGDVAVPPVSAKYRTPDGTEGDAKTEAISLHVVSLFPKDPQEQKLADNRPPLALSIGGPFWVALGLFLILAVSALLWIRRRRHVVSAPQGEAPEAPPDAEARAALALLTASGLLEGGDLRQFYIRLTEIAKRYLERRLSAPIVEMTSAETMATLRDHPRASVVALPMRSLLGAADPVKFARGTGATEEAAAHLAAVGEMIASLESRLTAAAETREQVA